MGTGERENLNEWHPHTLMMMLAHCFSTQRRYAKRRYPKVCSIHIIARLKMYSNMLDWWETPQFGCSRKIIMPLPIHIFLSYCCIFFVIKWIKLWCNQQLEHRFKSWVVALDWHSYSIVGWALYTCHCSHVRKRSNMPTTRKLAPVLNF